MPNYQFTQEVFIGGSPKSGTTLLLSLLDGTPGLIVFPEEVALFNRALPRTGDKDPSAIADYALRHTDLKAMQVISALEPYSGQGTEHYGDYSQFDFTAFKKALYQWQIKRDSAPATFFHNLFLAYAKTQAIPVGNYTIVEKTPANDYNWPKLRQYFPKAKLLQIVRDPRDVYASRIMRLRNQHSRHKKAFRLLNEWNRSVFTKDGFRDAPEKFLSIRYCDLVEKTDQILKQIATFLGVDPGHLSQKPTRAGQFWAGNSSSPDTHFQGISNTSIGRWKTQLSPEDVWWIEFHCSKGMDLYNYPIVSGLSNPIKNVIQWFRPISGESMIGYLKSRRASLCAQVASRFMMRADR